MTVAASIGPRRSTGPRQIGVIGGVGPEAGLDLVRKIIASTRATKDQEHLPVLMASLPHRVSDRTAFLLGHTSENPGHALADIATQLVAGGSEVIGMPCNTAHAPIIFDIIRDRVAGHCDLVHMVEEVTEEIARRAAPTRTIGVLATTGTIASGVYHDALNARGHHVLELPPGLQAGVQAAIYDPAYGIKSGRGSKYPGAGVGLHAAAEHLIRDGADLIVLACTEIPLVLTEPEIGGVPLVDATLVLARALVRRSDPGALSD